MKSPLFILTSAILLLGAPLITLTELGYMYQEGINPWVAGALALTIISYIARAYIAEAVIQTQKAIPAAITANASIIVLQTILLLASFLFAPEDIWWLLTLSAWDISRHPMQYIVSLSSKAQWEQPIFFYASHWQVFQDTVTHLILHTYITGYASIIAAIVLYMHNNA